LRKPNSPNYNFTNCQTPSDPYFLKATCLIGSTGYSFNYLATNNILRGTAYDNDVIYMIENGETAAILMKNEKRGMALTLYKPKTDKGRKPVLPGFWGLHEPINGFM
jgi:hypothetical protein